jgi:deoxyadenosine/deoxycytidine kinase
MLIAVEGCIGSGKTTVATGLARYRKCQVLLEAFELNPFLMKFYEDPRRYALETEFAFLLVHYHQLRTQHKDRGQECVADFTFIKDLIYANLNLDDPHANLVFHRLFGLLSGELPPPELLICLHAPDALVLSRIHKRCRTFELSIEPEYYARLNSAYHEFFAQYSGPKLDIKMNEWDFEEDHNLFARLSEMIDKRLAAI